MLQRPSPPELDEHTRGAGGLSGFVERACGGDATRAAGELRLALGAIPPRRVVAMRRTLIDLLPRRVGSGLAARLVRAMTEADPAQVAPAGAANPGGSPASWPSASKRRAGGY